MSKGRPWYKRYPSDFLHGTMTLSLEEKGAYSICLDLMYERGGPIPDDDRMIARMCGCGMRRWRQIRQRLIGTGKLNPTDDQRLANGRATYEMHRSEADRADMTARGKRGGRPAKPRAESGQRTPKKVEKNSTFSQENLEFFERDSHENNELVSGEQKQTQRLRKKESLVPSESSTLKRQSPPRRAPRGEADRCSADPRAELRTRGADLLRSLTRWSSARCQSAIGKLLRDHGDDCVLVMAAIRRAVAVDPAGDVYAFLTGTLTAWAPKPEIRDPSLTAGFAKGRQPTPMVGGLV